jgi:putative SOS response-associated peptidase YedK
VPPCWFRMQVHIFWRMCGRREDGKQPYRFRRKDLEPFSFAGVWEFARLGGAGTLMAACYPDCIEADWHTSTYQISRNGRARAILSYAGS